jgi:uncharacterized protein
MGSSVSSSRAVAVMGKIPRAGETKTRLTPPPLPDTAARLYAAFLEDVFALVDEAHRISEAPFERVFACALSPGDDGADAHALVPAGWRLFYQRGADLGARIANVYEDTAAFHAVIIGSDSPTMPPSRLLEAFAHLEAGARAVFGPTTDGGYDLIALAAIERALLDGIPWSTPLVMEATRAKADKAQIPILELALGYDIDAFEDLARALADASTPGSIAHRTRDAIREALASFRPAD